MVQRFFRGQSTPASGSEWVVNNYGRRLLVGSSFISAGPKRHVLQIGRSLKSSNSPPPNSSPPPPQSQSGSGGFSVVDPKVVIIMVVLLFALICAAFINSLMRFVLRRRARQRHARAMLVHREGDSSEQGLDSKTLATLPVLTFKVGEVVGEISKPLDVDCTICLSEFTEDDILRLLPKCNHVFHLDCIDMWLLSHTSCPVCRDPIKADGDDAASAPTLEEARESGGSIFLTRDHQGNASARITTGLGADILSTGKGDTLDVRAELVRDTSWNSLSDARYTGSRRLTHREGSMDRLGSSRHSFRAPIAVLQPEKLSTSARWQASSSAASAPPALLPSTDGGLAAHDDLRAGDRLIEMNGSALSRQGSLA